MGLLSDYVDSALERRGAVIMGVVNTTPDSFFDGGRYRKHDAARRRVDELIDEGADIIDIGAESSRPGATPVSPEEQLARSLPVLEHAVSRGVVVSIDTTSSEVAEQALYHGAKVVNDVSCGRDDELARVTARAGADLILMHSRGNVGSMSGDSKRDGSRYDDVVADVCSEWRAAEKRARAAGLAADELWFDPGLGFHKSARTSWEILRRLDEFRGLGQGMVLGASRKSFIGALDDSPPAERIGGSIAACLLAIQRGAAILRVHDVRASLQAILAHRAGSGGAHSGSAHSASSPLKAANGASPRVRGNHA